MDFELWDALDKAHLKELVESWPLKLEHQISEQGENIRFLSDINWSISNN